MPLCLCAYFAGWGISTWEIQVVRYGGKRESDWMMILVLYCAQEILILVWSMMLKVMKSSIIKQKKNAERKEKVAYLVKRVISWSHQQLMFCAIHEIITAMYGAFQGMTVYILLMLPIQGNEPWMCCISLDFR